MTLRHSTTRTTPVRPAAADVRRRGAAWRIAHAGVALVLASISAVAVAPAATASPASVQAQEWWISRLGLEVNNKTAGGAWQITKGSGVTVAVFDQGVDAEVPDLRGALVAGFASSGSASPDVVHDDEGHGTQMAAYIAGRGTGPGVLGVAPAAKVMPVYIAGDPDTDTAAALNRLSAMTTPPSIVNMSYVSVGACPADLQSAVAKAVDKGIILVASAGNLGDADNQTEFPANCKGVVAAGAFDDTGKPWASTQRQPYVSIGGPGVHMVTYDKDLTLGTADGTSNSAAVVSGELALLRSHWPTMSSRQLVAKLFATTAKHTYSGPGYGSSQDVLGYGIGVVNAALRTKVPSSAPNAVYDALAKLGAPASGSGSGTPSSGPGTVSEGFPGADSTPAPGSTSVDFPGTASGKSDSGSNTGVIVGVVIGIVVILALIVLVVALRRRNGQRAGGGFSA